jgi:DNA primase
VTFPLELDGKITNFYGRFAGDCDKKNRHRKLPRSENVPQGGFNITRSVESGSKFIPVVESVCDGLALMQFGYPTTSAIVGIDNVVIIDELARHDQRFGIALNDDEAGRNGTIKLINAFAARGRVAFDLGRELYAQANNWTLDDEERSTIDDVNKLWIAKQGYSRSE